MCRISSATVKPSVDRICFGAAQEIISLGFGYDPDSLKRLRLTGFQPGTKGVGSVYGMEREEILQASHGFGFSLDVGLNTYKCARFLRAAASLV